LAAAVREAAREAGSAGHASLLAEAAAAGGLTGDELVSDAAVVLFGGIETTEGMICNAILALGSQETLEIRGAPGRRDDPFAMADLVPAVVEESLRLEPAAARVDRYATRDVTLGAARIRRGDAVIVSLTGANRDPATFPEPDRFDPRRPGAD